MFKKGVAISFIFGISTLIQLISQIIITRIFGASVALDTFLAAVAIPSIIVTVIYANFNDALLPLLGDKKAKNKEDVDQYFFSHLITLTLLSFAIAIVLMGSSNLLSNLLYSARGTNFINEVAYQMRFLFLSIPLSVFTAICGTYLYFHKKFIRFPLVQLIGNISNLLIIFLLSEQIGIWSLIVGFVFAIIIQMFFVFDTKVFNQTFKFANTSNFMIALIPLIIGSFALRSDTLIIRSYGSLLEEGSLVYLNLISKIFSLATGVVTIGIQVLLLPHLVEYISKKEFEKTIYYVNKAKIMGILITLFVITLLILFTPLVIKYLFVGGKFTLNDAENTSSMIPYFILPAVAWGVNSIFFQPLIALKKQVQLGALNVIALIFAVISAWATNLLIDPFSAIIVGISTLLLTGIIGSEILWQYYKKKLLISQ